jgi:hypothetical protein
MIFYISRERAHLKAPNSTEFSVLLCFFVKIIGKEKVQDEKNIRFAKLLFFLSRIICFVSLMEVFELRFRYSFVQNFQQCHISKILEISHISHRSYVISWEEMWVRVRGMCISKGDDTSPVANDHVSRREMS